MSLARVNIPAAAAAAASEEGKEGGEGEERDEAGVEEGKGGEEESVVSGG
jgi:ribosomal protein L12E/L44/L45/RPP1/RPP2